MSEGSNRSGTDKKSAISCDCLKNYIKKVARLYAIQQKSAQKKFEHLLYTQYIF